MKEMINRRNVKDKNPYVLEKVKIKREHDTSKNFLLWINVLLPEYTSVPLTLHVLHPKGPGNTERKTQCDSHNRRIINYVHVEYSIPPTFSMNKPLIHVREITLFWNLTGLPMVTVSTIVGVLVPGIWCPNLHL